jgi:hypothetical protein
MIAAAIGLMVALAASRGLATLLQVPFVFNTGIAVIASADQVAAIAQLPGVKAVHPLITKYLDHTSSVPLIGAPPRYIE